MPKENERDVKMTPDYARNKFKVQFVSSIREVLEATPVRSLSRRRAINLASTTRNFTISSVVS
jgi:predicted ATP-dependent protease